jgi:hypothetical protein
MEPGGAVINSDSVITATIKAVRQESTGDPLEFVILVNTSASVGDLPKPGITLYLYNVSK